MAERVEKELKEMKEIREKEAQNDECNTQFCENEDNIKNIAKTGTISSFGRMKNTFRNLINVKENFFGKNNEKEKSDITALDWLKKSAESLNKGQTKEASKAVQKGLKIDPQEIELWLFQAKIYDLNNMPRNALKSLDSALKINPQNQTALSNKGSTLSKLGKYAEALEFCESAVKINPNDKEAWNNIGGCLENMNKFNEALVAFDKAITIDKDFVLALFNKGSVLTTMGRYSEGVNLLERMLSCDPSPAFASLAWYNIGICYGKLGDYSSGLDAYDNALNINKNFTAARQNREMLLKLMQILPDHRREK